MLQSIFCKIVVPGFGLANQLFPIVNYLTICHEQKIKVLILDNFLQDYKNLNSKCSISQILDLPAINKWLLSEGEDIILVDITNMKFEIKQILYGVNNNVIDITNKINNSNEKIANHPSKVFEMSDKFKNNLYIPKNKDLNEYAGDPLPGQEKKLFIRYSINGINLENIYLERRKEDIILPDRNDKSYNILLRNNIPLTEKFIKALKFNKVTLLDINEFANIKDFSNNRISVFHIRLEEDGIPFWANINKISAHTFKHKLIEKYKYLIQTYLNKNNLVIILCANHNNEIIQYLKEQNYKIFILQNKGPFREINALQDLILSQKCNDTYIGNYNPNTHTGSTFSYFVSVRMSSQVKKIIIDLDHINQPEYII